MLPALFETREYEFNRQPEGAQWWPPVVFKGKPMWRGPKRNKKQFAQEHELVVMSHGAFTCPIAEAMRYSNLKLAQWVSLDDELSEEEQLAARSTGDVNFLSELFQQGSSFPLSVDWYTAVYKQTPASDGVRDHRIDEWNTR